MNKKQIESLLREKPGYLKHSYKRIKKTLFPNNSIEDIQEIVYNLRMEYYPRTPKKAFVAKIPKEKTIKKLYIHSNKELDPNNVIFLPDLHAPFIKEGVLGFCKEEQLKYNCGTVIFAGDIIDGHAWSYHEHDPDGYSVGDELLAAKEQLQDWYRAFPNAISCMGNHDLLIERKARTIGLSKYFIKGFGDVIEAPKTWKFVLEHIQDNVLYKHGNVGDAFKVAKESRISTCQGHFHSKSFVQWSVSEKDAIFGLQVGWGADRHEYAFDYGKSFTSKPIISLGAILDRGRTPIIKIMEL